MKLFERVLKRLVTRGQLTVHYANGESFTVGRPDPAFPTLALRLHDGRVPFDIVRDPRLGMAEAWIDGRVGIEGGGIMEFISMIRANNPWEAGRSIDARSRLRRRDGDRRLRQPPNRFVLLKKLVFEAHLRMQQLLPHQKPHEYPLP